MEENLLFINSTLVDGAAAVERKQNLLISMLAAIANANIKRILLALQYQLFYYAHK
jgi:hypothetical protein